MNTVSLAASFGLCICSSFLILIYKYAGLSVCLPPVYRCLRRPEQGFRASVAGFTGSCEPPDMGSRTHRVDPLEEQ